MTNNPDPAPDEGVMKTGQSAESAMMAGFKEAFDLVLAGKSDAEIVSDFAQMGCEVEPLPAPSAPVAACPKCKMVHVPLVPCPCTPPPVCPECGIYPPMHLRTCSQAPVAGDASGDTASAEGVGTLAPVRIDDVLVPVDSSFAAINEFVHDPEVSFEELQSALLGMAVSHEALEREARTLSSQLEDEQHKCGVWRSRYADIKNAFTDSGNCWVWQSDGDNNLETITCSILIRPDQMQEIVSEARRLRAENESLKGKRFRIMDGPSIPWWIIAPWEGQAMKNHCGQSLERLQERGGLSVQEAFAVLSGRSYREIDRTVTAADLLKLVASLEGALKAEAQGLREAIMQHRSSVLASADFYATQQDTRLWEALSGGKEG